MKMANFLLEDLFFASGDDTYAYWISFMYVHVGGRGLDC